MADRKDFKALPSLLTSVKLEPGTSGRLPSFRAARDYTLGAHSSGDSKPRKVYTPNLNVQRNKIKADVKEVKEEVKESDFKGHQRGRGRGRGRGSSNLVQTTGGVFAEGIASEGIGRRFGSGNRNDDSRGNPVLEKPKLNLEHNKKFDKGEEEGILKELLRDNFLDDENLNHDDKYSPIQLPMLKKGTKIEKSEEKSSDSIKIKTEVVDEPPPDLDVSTMILPENCTLQQLFERKFQQLVFIQLPDCLPGLKLEEDQANTSSESSVQTRNQCILSSLSEGCIGQIKLHKSGKAILHLGNNALEVNMGTQISFRQDLMSVNLNESTHTGSLINLGGIQSKLVMTPQWELMLSKRHMPEWSSQLVS